MAGDAPFVPLSGEESRDDAAVQRPWRKSLQLSSTGDAVEAFLAGAGLDRGPWLAVGFAAGIAAWFVLPGPPQWWLALSLCALCATGAQLAWGRNGRRVYIAMAATAIGGMVAGGLVVAWARSSVVGVAPIARPLTATIDGRVLQREEQPAEQRIRLVLATREPESGRAIRVRVNLPQDHDLPGLAEGAVIRVKARLMPPAPPMLPGAYDFARTAWFKGYAATGNLSGEVVLLQPGGQGGWVARTQRALSAHVRANLDGSPGAIAAALEGRD